MNNKLSPEKALSNWKTFMENVKTHIKGVRCEQLLAMYEDLEGEVVAAPASISATSHNCFPGGYVDHVNRVVECALQLYATWERMGCDISEFTVEELVFCAINHDLGKIGFKNTPNYLVNDNDWEVTKLHRNYKINPENPFSTVPDRSIFILQSYGIKLTYNEYLGIKLHDGLYDEANKPYLISYNVESRLRTALPLIVHQADMIAARVEWEQEWLSKVGKKPEKSNGSSNSYKGHKDGSLSTVRKHANPSVLEALKGL